MLCDGDFERVGHVQHHQAAQPAEGVVGHVADVVEGERHGLQAGQLAQRRGWDVPQSVVVQPEVAQRVEPREAAGGNLGDVVGVQTAAETSRETERKPVKN